MVTAVTPWGFQWTPTILFARPCVRAHSHGDERTLTVNVRGASHLNLWFHHSLSSLRFPGEI